MLDVLMLVGQDIDAQVSFKSLNQFLCGFAVYHHVWCQHYKVQVVTTETTAC